MGRGTTGGSTGGIEYSKERIARMEKAKTRTEERWAKRAGPVKTAQAEKCPNCGGWLWPEREHGCVGGAR